MVYLFLASALWALSYGLNNQELSSANPFLVATIYCIVSFLIFLPYIKTSKLSKGFFSKLLAIGAIQFGLMYGFFQCSFFFLDGHEIALWLLSTPLFVLIINSFFEKTLSYFALAITCLVVVLSGLLINRVAYVDISWMGVMCLQLCNISFALGQVLFKRFCKTNNIENVASIISVLYFGGVIVCAVLSLVFGLVFDYKPLGFSELMYVILIGSVCCGLCHFLWNKGILKVSLLVLAIMSNAQVPLGIIFSYTIFNEKINLAKLSFSLLLITIFLISGLLIKKRR